MHLMTMIDPVSSWFECAAVSGDPDSNNISKIFDDVWLARYPRPSHVGCDGGSEFKLYFKQLCANYGMKLKTSGAWNPQANAVIERVHQVLGNMLRTFDLDNAEIDDEDPWSEFISSTCFAIRSTYHTTIGASPAELVFGRDMILPVQYKADWNLITQRKQRSINKSNERENSQRVDHQFSVGDLCLLKIPGILRKLQCPKAGPYEILHVHDNGTVTIQKDQLGVVTDRVNIRHIEPFYGAIDSSDDEEAYSNYTVFVACIIERTWRRTYRIV